MDEHDVELQGIALRYATWGQAKGDGEAILLIHGLTSSSLAWARLAPTLASAGFFVVAPDLRGRGHSSKPPHGYSIPQHAHDLLTLCDMLDLPTVHIVGHSLGAQIALYLAAMYPERVSRLVLIDAGGTFPPDTREAIGASLARLDTVYPSLDEYLSAMSRSPAHPWDAFWEAYYRYDATVHTDGTVTSRVPRAAIEEEMHALDLLDLDRLPLAVRAPTLILRAPVGLLGPDRGLVLTTQAAEWLRETIPNSQVEDIPDTNHYTILLAEDLERHVITFLARMPAGAESVGRQETVYDTV
jgi:pimeloyl-ACP methyl ester carboxylesterase